MHIFKPHAKALHRRCAKIDDAQDVGYSNADISVDSIGTSYYNDIEAGEEQIYSPLLACYNYI